MLHASACLDLNLRARARAGDTLAAGFDFLGPSSLSYEWVSDYYQPAGHRPVLARSESE